MVDIPDISKSIWENQQIIYFSISVIPIIFNNSNSVSNGFNLFLNLFSPPISLWTRFTSLMKFWRVLKELEIIVRDCLMGFQWGHTTYSLCWIIPIKFQISFNVLQIIYDPFTSWPFLPLFLHSRVCGIQKFISIREGFKKTKFESDCLVKKN